MTEEQGVLKAILEEFYSRQGDAVTETRGAVGKNRVEVVVVTTYASTAKGYADIVREVEALVQKLEKTFPKKNIRSKTWPDEEGPASRPYLAHYKKLGVRITELPTSLRS